MFRGYYKNPKLTKEAFDGDWFRTGDIGRIEDGHLIFEKEKKKSRKVNGNMVDLKELERMINILDKKNHTNLKTALINKIAIYKIPYISSKKE